MFVFLIKSKSLKPGSRLPVSNVTSADIRLATVKVKGNSATSLVNVTTLLLRPKKKKIVVFRYPNRPYLKFFRLLEAILL